MINQDPDVDGPFPTISYIHNNLKFCTFHMHVAAWCQLNECPHHITLPCSWQQVMTASLELE